MAYNQDMNAAPAQGPQSWINNAQGKDRPTRQMRGGLDSPGMGPTQRASGPGQPIMNGQPGFAPMPRGQGGGSQNMSAGQYQSPGGQQMWNGQPPMQGGGQNPMQGMFANMFGNPQQQAQSMGLNPQQYQTMQTDRARYGMPPMQTNPFAGMFGNIFGGHQKGY